MLVNLSSTISTEQDLRTLGIVALEMEHHVVQTYLTNNAGNITNAAYKLLIKWRKTQPDSHTAYTKMAHGIIYSKLMYLMKVLMD